jgi:AAA+ ATPase superfamily predicted ATPase
MLASLPMEPPPIVILDEFTYLVSGNKALPSILQKAWDERLKDTHLKIVLCGSYIGMMESEVLGYRAPLYGRRTASALLSALDLPASTLFFPNYSAEGQFLTWAVLGGMPFYLRVFTDQQDVFSNIRQHILDSQSGTLFSEPRLLLMEELREPRNYFSILRSIAQGRTRLNEITQASGVGEPTSVARYLDILQQMRLVTRRVPVTEPQPEKSKKGIYQIDDHFLRFWFRYVHPNQSGLDLGLADAILEKHIRPDFDHFVSAAFEEAARGFIANEARRGTLNFLPERIGSWWNRAAEIDVVANSQAEKIALVGECKWSINPIGVNILDDLKHKAGVLLKDHEIRRFEYALFARAGFTPALKDRALSEGLRLYTLESLVNPIYS